MSSADGPAAEVTSLCQALLRFDTSNYGDGRGPGERAAAEWVAGQLDDAGLSPTVLESAPGRASVVARLEGADRSRPALLLHGHLDVVPADASHWQVDPFAGDLQPGTGPDVGETYLWGRGAVDMKDMVAMTLAVARARATEGRLPPRDIVLAFVADEEAGGVMGAQWLVKEHAELFADATDCVGEVGGFSVTVPGDRRIYLVEAAQKGISWLRLTAHGRAGHGSFLNDDNAVTALSRAVARLGSYEFPQQLIPTVERMLREVAEILGLPYDPEDLTPILAGLGSVARIAGATLRHTVSPTMLSAGYKANVIPQTATATVDGRFLPGDEEGFAATVAELVGPGIDVERVHHDIGLETTFDGPVVEAMTAALLAEDPGALPVPYCLSGGTDGKSFSTLGMRVFGFSPLRLPPDLAFAELFHGIDERVPVSGLEFGARVLDRFLDGV